jgi:hypothetical protein
LGNTQPETCIFGCDVDHNAFEILDQHLDRVSAEAHFIQGDFLSFDPADFPRSEFDVVIGNPPYVSLHNMSPAQRAAAQEAISRAGFALGAKASLWAYFVLHSIQFLRRGGRMAWVLPGSLLHSDYSIAVRNTLQATFQRCLAVTLDERLFLEEGTEESSVVLLCEGLGGSPGAAIDLAKAADLSELQARIEDWAGGQWQGSKWEDRPLLGLLSNKVTERYLSIESNAQPLSNYISVLIGIVTGANKFFVLNEAAVEQHMLPDDLIVPIVARFSQCRGLSLSLADLQELRNAGLRCLFLDTRRATSVEGALAEYLATFSPEERAENKTFQKRTVWHQPDDGKVPDAFFSCMQADGPTLVLNKARVTCTNTVHRIFFKDGVSQDQRKLIAVALQSTFSQLSAEIEGRSYGSGGLKLEPSEVRRISVLLPLNVDSRELESTFTKVEGELRAGNRSGARHAADAFLVCRGSLMDSEVTLLEEGLNEIRKSRRSFRGQRIVGE